MYTVWDRKQIETVVMQEILQIKALVKLQAVTSIFERIAEELHRHGYYCSITECQMQVEKGHIAKPKNILAKMFSQCSCSIKSLLCTSTLEVVYLGYILKNARPMFINILNDRCTA